MYTDPTGEFWHLIVGGIIGGIQGYMIGKAHGAKGWAMFGYILGGAAIGGVAGYTGFSVFSSAMAAGTAAGMGGISAGFNAGLLSGMASGAITGGGMAALRGGSFSDVLAGATMGAWSGAVAGGISGAIAGEMHNIKDGLNFWGNQNSRNTSNLLASLDSPGNIYLGPNNGRLQGVSVYATDLRVAVAAREGMNAAGRFIFQAAMYGSMAASTVGISAAVGGVLWRMGARQAAKSGTVAFRSVGAAGKEVFNPANFKAVSQSYLKGIGIEDIHAFKAEWLGTNQGLKLFDVVKNTATNELLIIRKTTQEVVERTYIIGP